MNNTVRQNVKMPFAVGCFNFTYKQKPPYKLTIAAYRDAVEKALQGIANINNLHVVQTEALDVELEVDEEPKGLDYFGELFPFPPGMHIEFDVYIPRRIQQEVTRGLRERDIGTENFKVYIDHRFSSPVCFIAPVNGGREPSGSIVVIREYLKRELNKVDSSIWLEAQGPSPFHADFFLLSNDQIEEVVEVEVIEQRGYDDVVISYDPAPFDGNRDSAFEYVRQNLGDELDVYYTLERYRVTQIQKWNEIERLLSIVSDTAGRKLSFLSKLKNTITRGSVLSELHSALVDFEANEVTSHHALRRAVRDTYKGESDFIKKYVVAHVEEPEVYPVSQLGRLVNFLAAKRAKNAELVIVLIAAIVGGVTGSLLTMVTQRASVTNSVEQTTKVPTENK